MAEKFQTQATTSNTRGSRRRQEKATQRVKDGRCLMCFPAQGNATSHFVSLWMQSGPRSLQYDVTGLTEKCACTDRRVHTGNSVVCVMRHPHNKLPATALFLFGAVVAAVEAIVSVPHFLLVLAQGDSWGPVKLPEMAHPWSRCPPTCVCVW